MVQSFFQGVQERRIKQRDSPIFGKIFLAYILLDVKTGRWWVDVVLCFAVLYCTVNGIVIPTLANRSSALYSTQF